MRLPQQSSMTISTTKCLDGKAFAAAGPIPRIHLGDLALSWATSYMLQQ